MNVLRYTLLSDGSSDQALFPILSWVLREHGVRHAIQPEWADLSRLPRRHGKSRLLERIRWSLELYPCDLLFIHRDAEKETYQARVDEIKQGVEVSPLEETKPFVCVVPVRMLEAWLLSDEQAIRFASGNPNGLHPLHLPSISRLEELPDPKNTLYDLLREASGLSGRRRRKLHVTWLARRVTDYSGDFAPLRNLSAFQALEAEIEELIKSQGWNTDPE